MREYVFRVYYQEGVDPISDLYIQHPDAICKCISMMGTGTSLWCVARISGPGSAIQPLVDTFVSSEVCNECLVDDGRCMSEGSNYQVIDHNDTGATVYSHHWGTSDCLSVPMYAAEYLGAGILFDAVRRANVYEWRVLVPDDRNIQEMYNALKERSWDGITISLDQISTPARWGEGLTTVADLPTEQRRALNTAVEMGYYETPRPVTTDEVASALGIPGSTLRYRLRKAEGYLLPKFVQDSNAFKHDPRESVRIE